MICVCSKKIREWTHHTVDHEDNTYLTGMICPLVQQGLIVTEVTNCFLIISESLQEGMNAHLAKTTWPRLILGPGWELTTDVLLCNVLRAYSWNSMALSLCQRNLFWQQVTVEMGAL